MDGNNKHLELNIVHCMKELERLVRIRRRGTDERRKVNSKY